MKLLPPLHPLRSLAILGCLLVLSCGLGRAQTPVADNLDVFFGETKLLPIDRPIDDFTVVPDNIVKVQKVDGSPNQLSIVGIAGGSAVLTVKSDGRTLLYDVAVSPAPERLYINLNESKRLSFPDNIDDTSLSQQGIVRIVQPDTTDKVLLLEADAAGKTTLTVYSKGEIYRYFISTFDNRGADVLEIQNAFSAKGYRNLTIAFDKDQAILSGTVPTQEELDDAVRIVKQFTQYVVVKAQLGQEVEQSEFSEEESIIINNIQRIANVKGLTIRVKFPAPTVITTSHYTKSVGDFITPSVTTTPQGGTVRGSGFEPPKDPNQQSDTTGPLAVKPLENTTEETEVTKNTSLPEKIFLYGDLADDLEEAKVIRVARTFCPFIVNFLTVKDPIQVRTQIRFMQVSDSDNSNTGFDWSTNGAGPQITLGFGDTPFSLLPNPLNAFKNFITSPGTLGSGVTATVSATAVLNLFQTLGVTKELREADLFLTNGQPGYYSEGEVKAYISGTTVVVGTASTNTSPTTADIFLGVNMDISPLNLANAGGTEPAGQKILGIPSSITSGYNVQSDSGATPDNVAKVGTIQQGGVAPVIDNTVMYVDENGLIGMNISTQLTVPGNFTTIDGITLPDVFVRTTRTRVNLRDGQTVAIDGLIDREVTRNITQVPFLAKIPLFSTFFKSHTDASSNEEVIVLVTPHIVRMRDPDSARYPKPYSPEMENLARETGDIPIIKPVRYNAEAVDLRPETPKDMKDSKNDSAPVEPPPRLTPHASGGMQTLQPPSDATSAPATPPVDNTAPAPDSTRQPSTIPPTLAPTSTLP